jgi:hypothetical protein
MASREKALAGRVLAERRELAITAAQIAPPLYIRKELGERPIDPAKRREWERGVEGVESYRQEHGIKDPHRAFGREAERLEQQQARRRLRETQRALGLEPQGVRTRDLGRSAGIEL